LLGLLELKQYTICRHVFCVLHTSLLFTAPGAEALPSPFQESR